MPLPNAPPSINRAGVHLTERETEILILVAQGHSSMAVANALVVSRRTIDFHLANSYRKLCATNRITAILTARRLGLIPHEFARGASQRAPTQRR